VCVCDDDKTSCATTPPATSSSSRQAKDGKGLCQQAGVQPLLLRVLGMQTLQLFATKLPAAGVPPLALPGSLQPAHAHRLCVSTDQPGRNQPYPRASAPQRQIQSGAAKRLVITKVSDSPTRECTTAPQPRTRYTRAHASAKTFVSHAALYIAGVKSCKARSCSRQTHQLQPFLR
jgi:hypothetical protein